MILIQAVVYFVLTLIVAYLKSEDDFPAKIIGIHRKGIENSVNIEDISHKYKKNWVL